MSFIKNLFWFLLVPALVAVGLFFLFGRSGESTVESRVVSMAKYLEANPEQMQLERARCKDLAAHWAEQDEVCLALAEKKG